jgi:hypothetical protein
LIGREPPRSTPIQRDLLRRAHEDAPADVRRDLRMRRNRGYRRRMPSAALLCSMTRSGLAGARRRQGDRRL